MPRKPGAAALESAYAALRSAPRRFLVTGSAGFIGSHLVQALLAAGQEVVGLDDFSTGHRSNLDEVRGTVGEALWRRHVFLEGDIADWTTCVEACDGVDIVLHEAALGSVPRSIADPRATHAANATGFLNLITAARDAGVKRFVYAASSSTYGDSPELPKVEDRIGRPLSPYAVTKYLNELYADVFGRCYGLASVGLRYFNVFGARQDPEGAYAAVIPRWVAAMLSGQTVTIYGDGETTRDFCYVDNVVQANLLAALASAPTAIGQVYNVAVGGRMSLNELHSTMAGILRTRHPGLSIPNPRYEPFRAGDVRHSQADTTKARTLLGYEPEHGVRDGLEAAMPWYELRSAGADALRRTPPATDYRCGPQMRRDRARRVRGRANMIRWTSRGRRSIACVAAWLLGMALPVLAQPVEPEDTIARVKLSIVAVGTYERTRSPAFQFMGTGFAVGDGTLVVTNAHVLPASVDAERRERIAILVPGTRTVGTDSAKVEVREATTVARDASHDLAVLRIEGLPLPPLPIGDSTKVREGRSVYFTGFPIGSVLGAYAATHRAIVSAITPIAIPQRRAAELDSVTARRLVSGAFPVFQLDGIAYPGNSGSPVYEAGGTVIGVVNMVLVRATKESLLSQPSGIAYAIPSEHVRALLSPVR